jgi:hypothetical protein
MTNLDDCSKAVGNWEANVRHEIPRQARIRIDMGASCANPVFTKIPLVRSPIAVFERDLWKIFSGGSQVRKIHVPSLKAST